MLLNRKKAVDMHLHILPGLDDGARTMRDAVRMAQISVDSGVGTVVVTPHANQIGRFENYATYRMRKVYDDFCIELRHQCIPLEVIPGMEIFATRDVVERIRKGMLCPLGRTNRYLIEFPFDADEYYIREILEKMLLHGYCPVIAHPERYYCVQDRPTLVRCWREIGCVAQMNRGSVQGQFGFSCRMAAEELIARGWVDVFGSDAHGTEHRTPEMESIRRYLVNCFGLERADTLLIDNPSKILGIKING